MRPLLAKTELEVRKHVLQWVDYVRQTPDLDANTEEKLIAVMSQLIEQKFRRLNYKELSKMIRLTPLAETTSGQEWIKDERVALLMQQIRRKFTLSDELVEGVNQELQRLELTSLKALFNEILDANTFEELETWITTHTPPEGSISLPENGWLDDTSEDEG